MLITFHVVVVVIVVVSACPKKNFSYLNFTDKMRFHQKEIESPTDFSKCRNCQGPEAHSSAFPCCQNSMKNLMHSVSY